MTRMNQKAKNSSKVSSSYSGVCSYFLFLVALLLVQSAVFAEEVSERGRNADGTAYRTDAQGNQIVDYIAELEVTNEALERRIRGLVNEIQDLRKASENAPQLGSRARLVERELLSDQPMTNSPTAEVKEQLPTREQSCGEEQCSYLIDEVVAREKRVVQQVCDSSLKKLSEELQERQNKGASELVKVRSEAGFREKSLEDLLAQREQELQEIRVQLANSTEEKNEVVKQYEEVKLRLATITSKRDSEGGLGDASARGNGRVTEPALPVRASLEFAKGPSSPATPISDSDRQRVLARLQSVIQQRNKRDELFNSYNNRALSVGRRSIRSKSGQLPEQLLGLAKATQSQDQLRRLEAEAKHLEKLVVSDLLLMKRLSAR